VQHERLSLWLEELLFDCIILGGGSLLPFAAMPFLLCFEMNARL